MQKIIFLDVDGVICLYPEWQQDFRSNGNNRLSEYCCKNLKDILDTTRAKIILTSSWRLAKENKDDLFEQLERFGITKDYFWGETLDLSEESFQSHNELRWLEIADYIAKNKIKNYIIIDDFNLIRFDKLHLIRTKKHEGITAKLRDICINKLNS